MNCHRYHLAYRRFYQSEKVPDERERRVTLFRHVGYYPTLPPPIQPDAPVPDVFLELRSLMDKEAIKLLYTRYKSAEG